MTTVQLLLTLLLSTPVRQGTESTEELNARLESIAEDAFAVAPTVDDALLILAVAQHESGFALDVDKGPCRAGTCDSGRAACMMQIHASTQRRAELFADRRECFRVGLAALKSSMASCRENDEATKLAQYASGTCLRGKKGARELHRGWLNWRARYVKALQKELTGRVSMVAPAGAIHGER